MKNIQEILKEYWGFDKFRPLQEDIIRSVLEEKDTLALMPTGGGKSLCYQVPVMANPGIGLIISPLIALMKDQVENLRKKGITSFAIFSGMSRSDVVRTLELASESNCKFLYVSPERLETKLFKEYLPGLSINLIAVDEAHCISQWGYDFRPSYLRIAAIREEITDVPILALTASATSEVQKDICERLLFKGDAKSWHVFRQSFERPHLSYSVFNVESKINKIREVLEKVPGSSLVYCRSRKRTKEISETLQLQGISSAFYHAGLTSDERSRIQEQWMNNTFRVIVCTNAFGMGIDKPDVRTVMHADVPDCLENYYQEAGRAGRDNGKSYAVLLYGIHDLNELQLMAEARFPSLEDIRKVYQSVANYVQIESGSGVGQYFDFDINDFLKKFKINATTVLYSLKALEQEGWLSFNEQVFLPSQINFTTSKQTLYDYQDQNPDSDALIKTLLRAYEGIFDRPVPVSEKFIAGLLKTDIDKLKIDLLKLERAGIIQYQPQKDTPQLFLLRKRIKAEDLTIDMVQYNERKKQFEKRMRQMLRYVNEEGECRSRLIGKYFGDDDLKMCCICDNCLRQKNLHLDKKEFEDLRISILSSLKDESMHLKELTSKLGAFKKEKAWKVLEFLQSEKVINVADNGVVSIKV